MSNIECRIFPRCTHYISTVLLGPSYGFSCRLRCPSVCLPASLQLVTTAEPHRRLAALAYSSFALFSAKWKHRWRQNIGEKEDQNKILLMLGFFCCCYVPDHSVKILLFLVPPFIQVPPSTIQQLFDHGSTLVFAQDCAKSNCIVIPFRDHQRPG